MPPPSLCLCVWSFPQCKSRTWYLKERAEWWRHFYAPHFQRSYPSPTLFSKSIFFFFFNNTDLYLVFHGCAIHNDAMHSFVIISFGLENLHTTRISLNDSATRRRNTRCVSYREAISLALACFARSTYVEKVRYILRTPEPKRLVKVKETKRVWNVELLLISLVPSSRTFNVLNTIFGRWAKVRKDKPANHSWNNFKFLLPSLPPVTVGSSYDPMRKNFWEFFEFLEGLI